MNERHELKTFRNGTLNSIVAYKDEWIAKVVLLAMLDIYSRAGYSMSSESATLWTVKKNEEEIRLEIVDRALSDAASYY